MKTDCDIIRDLLPLYADGICSEKSSEAVEEHLHECPECREMLKKLRDTDIESNLREEKQDVISYGVRKFRQLSAKTGIAAFGAVLIPLLALLAVNLIAGSELGWFLILLAAMGVAFSLIAVPILVPESKLFWTLCAFTVSTELLLAVICLVTRGDWFWVAGSAVLFGLSVCFLPWAIRAKPLKRWVGKKRRGLIVLGVDTLLFLYMMLVIIFHQEVRYKVSLGILAGLMLVAVYMVKSGREDS
ncbi:MAG: zf-HC2 domain-containing protein [Clostridia bacterium]|nr:zf-HC2 domain-containing protein [Clostridia bacterium]